MDHITQLKKIRADAIARLRNSDDFKLAGKLGQLIVELGDTVDDISVFDETLIPAPSAAASAPETAKKEKDKSVAPTFETAFLPGKGSDYETLKSKELIEELVAEIEQDAVDLDACASEETIADDQDDTVDQVEADGEVVAKKVEEFNSLKNISAYFKSDKTDTGLANGAAH